MAPKVNYFSIGCQLSSSFMGFWKLKHHECSRTNISLMYEPLSVSCSETVCPRRETNCVQSGLDLRCYEC